MRLSQATIRRRLVSGYYAMPTASNPNPPLAYHLRNLHRNFCLAVACALALGMLIGAIISLPDTSTTLSYTEFTRAY